MLKYYRSLFIKIALLSVIAITTEASVSPYETHIDTNVASKDLNFQAITYENLLPSVNELKKYKFEETIPPTKRPHGDYEDEVKDIIKNKSSIHNSVFKVKSILFHNTTNTVITPLSPQDYDNVTMIPPQEDTTYKSDEYTTYSPSEDDISTVKREERDYTTPVPEDKTTAPVPEDRDPRTSTAEHPPRGDMWFTEAPMMQEDDDENGGLDPTTKRPPIKQRLSKYEYLIKYCPVIKNETGESLYPCQEYTYEKAKCIYYKSSEKCDGVYNCYYHEDEKDCELCNNEAFLCSDGICLNERLVCDGINHCSDDESHCCYKNDQFQCSSSYENEHCIDYEQLCDGEEDHPTCYDEINCKCLVSNYKINDFSKTKTNSSTISMLWEQNVSNMIVTVHYSNNKTRDMFKFVDGVKNNSMKHFHTENGTSYINMNLFSNYNFYKTVNWFTFFITYSYSFDHVEIRFGAREAYMIPLYGAEVTKVTFNGTDMTLNCEDSVKSWYVKPKETVKIHVNETTSYFEMFSRFNYFTPVINIGKTLVRFNESYDGMFTEFVSKFNNETSSRLKPTKAYRFAISCGIKFCIVLDDMQPRIIYNKKSKFIYIHNENPASVFSITSSYRFMNTKNIIKHSNIPNKPSRPPPPPPPPGLKNVIVPHNTTTNTAVMLLSTFMILLTMILFCVYILLKSNKGFKGEYHEMRVLRNGTYVNNNM
ncbi:hypothetical protein PvNV_099 [Penaeus vannamei nudivirus]|nr:low density lipoprotein receptor related protein [Penaeus vannamei nucleopolyhedrovirus]